MPMTVSIITPSFNQAMFVSSCLSSVRALGPSVLEHLVFDPGSTDGSRDIIRAFGGVTLITEPDEGQADAVGKGMLLAKGDIIGWLNSDDEYANASVLEVVLDRFAMADHPDIVYGSGVYIDADGTVIKEAFINRKPDTLPQALKKQVGILQPAVFFRRTVVERIGTLDKNLHFCLDYEYWIRAAQAGLRFAFIDCILARARYYSQNKTLGQRGKSLQEVCECVKKKFGFVHKFWFSSLAEFNVEGFDGVLKSSYNSKPSKPEVLKAEIRRLACTYNGDHDSLQVLWDGAVGSPEEETLQFMRDLGLPLHKKLTLLPKGETIPGIIDSATYPRVLIVDATPVGSASATGQIKEVFVDGWPEGCLMQVYEEGSDLRLKSWAEVGQEGGILTNSELLTACLEFAPDVLYFRPIDSERLFDFVERVMQDLPVPIVIHMMDDWPERLKVDDPEKFRNCDSALKRLLDTAAGRFSICQKMSDVYLKRYGHQFVPLANGVDLDEIPPKDWSLRPPVTEQRPFVIRYMGGMADDMQFESVVDIARTVSALSYQLPVRLEIHTMSWYLKKTKSALSGLRGVHVAGLVPAQDYRKTLSEADALLIAYNFDAATIRYTSLSMANKLPEVLASGAAVIAYGPTSIATIAYLEKAKCARTITIRNNELLSKCIAHLATNLDECRGFGTLGRDHVGRFMSKSLVKETFRQEMAKAARNAKGVSRPLLGSDSTLDRVRFTAVSTHPGTSHGEKPPLPKTHTPVPSSAPAEKRAAPVDSAPSITRPAAKPQIVKADVSAPSSAPVSLPRPIGHSPAIERPKPTFMSRLSVDMGQPIEGKNWSNPARVNGTSARSIASGQRATLVLSLKRDQAVLLLLTLPPRSSREQYDGVRLEIDGAEVLHTLHVDIDPPCLVASVPAMPTAQYRVTELAILVHSRTEPQGLTEGKPTGCAIAKVSVIPAFPTNFARALTVGKPWYQRLAGGLDTKPLAFPYSHFDGLAYVAANPDVAEAILGGRLSSGLHHYQRYGRSEGRACMIALRRNPSIGGLGEIFDGHAYLETYPDIAEAVRCGLRSSALEHYVQYGRKEGRRARLLFDGKARRGTASDLVALETLRTANAATEAIRVNISKEVAKQVGHLRSELTRVTSVFQTKLAQLTKEQSTQQAAQATKVATDLVRTTEELRRELARVTKEQSAQQAAQAAKVATDMVHTADELRGELARVAREQIARFVAACVENGNGGGSRKQLVDK